MDDQDVISVLIKQEKEHNEVIKEYQKSIRLTIIICFIALTVMYISTSINMAYQTKKIAEAADNIVKTYFETDYDYGTIDQSVEQTVEIGE